MKQEAEVGPPVAPFSRRLGPRPPRAPEHRQKHLKEDGLSSEGLRDASWSKKEVFNVSNMCLRDNSAANVTSLTESLYRPLYFSTMIITTT